MRDTAPFYVENNPLSYTDPTGNHIENEEPPEIDDFDFDFDFDFALDFDIPEDIDDVGESDGDIESPFEISSTGGSKPGVSEDSSKREAKEYSMEGESANNHRKSLSPNDGARTSEDNSPFSYKYGKGTNVAVLSTLKNAPKIWKGVKKAYKGLKGLFKRNKKSKQNQSRTESSKNRSGNIDDAAKKARTQPYGSKNSSKALDVTKPNSKYRNIKTDVKKREFEVNLTKSGFKKSSSKDGKVNIFTKGESKIITRDSAKSTGKPSADTFLRGKQKTKIRLGDD